MRMMGADSVAYYRQTVLERGFAGQTLAYYASRGETPLEWGGAGAPCPHDHVLLANVVETLDDGGGWKAADTNLWRDELHAATVVGRLAAARVAGELGYGIEPDAGASAPRALAHRRDPRRGAG